MVRIVRLPAFIILAMLTSCSNNHLIVDRQSRIAILDDYRARSEIYASSRVDLFSRADSLGEGPLREAVCFMLAYMPLSDMAVYEPQYLIDNASQALRTRDEMPWGKKIPDGLFTNFVLPLRVNNENPDDFRILFYDEIRKRVEGLGIMEAALEINRWCQERVSYQPSDIRTSSPMATILSARGRCGEESTLTVSALRTAGIPARQVYTPRWAHTDDNHAWVEFWADDAWHYMGACEPEPVPDRGWFTEPARRAMLVHTRAFGRYDGKETLVKKNHLFSEINTLDRYAKTKNLKVTVRDSIGNPVPLAETGYMLYNYAEFYPLATLICNSDGESSLMTGIGTLLIWANDGHRYGFALTSPSDTLAEVVIKTTNPAEGMNLDLIVPPGPDPYPGIDEEMVRQNNLLIKRGDSIRSACVNSWMTDINVEEIAAKASIPVESTERILRASMGNYHEITTFLLKAGVMGPLALRILENISEKDLRDTPAKILTDHLVNAPAAAPGSDFSLYDRYVLSPRIDNELLSPFRSALRELPDDLMHMFFTEPARIVNWIDTMITVSESENYYGTPLIPEGVLRLHAADRHSRDIFFVAVGRTAGIPARLEPGTGRAQYHENGEWHDVWYAGEARPSDNPGYLTFVSENRDFQPEYHVHFTLAHLEKGKFKTLDYGYGVKISDLPGDITLDPGTYMLTTGNRDENGNVMSSIRFFDLAPGEKKEIIVSLRELPLSGITREKTDLTGELLSFTGQKISLNSLREKGVVMLWVEPGKEPTRHLLNDLPSYKKEFDDWGGWFIFLTDPARTPASFNPEDITGTPLNTLFVSDMALTQMDSFLGSESSERQMPVVLYLNSEGEVLFSSEGYRIDTGEQILKKIRQ